MNKNLLALNRTKMPIIISTDFERHFKIYFKMLLLAESLMAPEDDFCYLKAYLLHESYMIKNMP